MWRNLIKPFERSLVLNSKQVTGHNNILQTYLKCKQTPQRSLACSALLRNAETVRAIPRSGGNEGDGEYIIPYKPEYEKRDTPKRIIQALRTRFHLSHEELERIMNDEAVLKTYRHKSLMDTLDALCAEGITKQNFVDYPWLLTLDKSK